MTLDTTLVWSLLACACLPAQAQLTQEFTFDTFDGDPALSIPDGNASGISDVREISGSFPEVTGVRVNLTLSGGFNGDLYVYLRRESAGVTDGFSVLLNRPGRTAIDSWGYADSGFDVAFADTALNDVHDYRLTLEPAPNAPLTGVWQPDARNVDPSAVTSDSPRDAFLSVFSGGAANGNWTLFAADLQSGGASQIESWGLEFTAVPETRHFPMIAGAGMIGVALWRLGTRRPRGITPRAD